MDNITEIISTGHGYVDAAIAGVSAAASAAVAWLAAKFDWWKRQTKPVRVAVAVGTFMVVALTLSVVTAPFA